MCIIRHSNTEHDVTVACDTIVDSSHHVQSCSVGKVLHNIILTVFSILNHVQPIQVYSFIIVILQQPLCFTSFDDCFSGGIDLTLTTYEACCQPLLDDNTIRRSFVSNDRCSECISKYGCYMHASMILYTQCIYMYTLQA